MVDGIDGLFNLSYNSDDIPYPMQESLVQQLIGIGLSDYEAGVFAVLSEHSPASAAFIAKKLDLSRSTVYTALERLIAKGLVGTTYKNEVKQFIAQPPSAIDDLLRREETGLGEKRRAFEGLAAHLALMRSGDIAVPRIIFFEGKESLKKIYLDMLRSSPKNATMVIIRDGFVWDKEWSFIFSKEWNDKVRRLRAEKNIATKLLVNDSKAEREHQRYYVSRKYFEFRYLPKEFAVNKFIIYVLGDTMSILSMEQGNLVGIKITNRHIANNFEHIFSALWKQASRAVRK